MNHDVAATWDATMEELAPFLGKDAVWHRNHRKFVGFVKEYRHQPRPNVQEKSLENQLAIWYDTQLRDRAQLGYAAVATLGNNEAAEKEEEEEDIAIAHAVPVNEDDVAKAPRASK
jgi:hypothetical protein